MNIELNIDEIQLNGFKTEDQRTIKQSLTNKLMRIFTEQGVPASLQHGGTLPDIRQTDFKASPDSAPSSVGTQLAQSLYGGFLK